jgi:hypothetical protein
VVIGSLLSLIGVCVLAAGGALAWAGTQRDGAGYFNTSSERLASQGFAVTSDVVDLGDEARPADWGSGIGELLKVRLRAEAAGAGEQVFVGVARTSDVDAYLAGVAHDVVVDLQTDPFKAEYRAVSGEKQPQRPEDQGFWVASSAGAGRQELVWTPRDGEWTVVMMNADAHKAVAAKVDVAIEVRHLWAIAAGLLGGGFLLSAGGVVLIVSAARPRR